MLEVHLKSKSDRELISNINFILLSMRQNNYSDYTINCITELKRRYIEEKQKNERR